MSATRPRPTVHVVFDTSCLFTEAADKLLSEEISTFVISVNENKDLDVKWHLPFIVKAERQYQMMLRARRLLPQLEKVERLLGHNLGITAEVLEARVQDAIPRQLQLHQMSVIELDGSGVNWNELIEAAVQRKPPFDPGEKEKGFRDAIVLECLCQLMAGLPKSLHSCRIIFVCGDDLLVQAARARTAERANVIIEPELDTLKTTLNALASQLTREAVDSILPEASKMFFTDNDNKKALFFAGDISETIRNQFRKEINSKPAPDFDVNVTTFYVSPPAFLSKAGQRLVFSSRVRIAVEAKKIIWRYPPNLLAGTAPISLGSLAGHTPGLLGAIPPSSATSSLGGLLNPSTMAVVPSAAPPPQLEEVRREGQHTFQVIWSVTLTARGKLVSPKVDNIEYKLTSWTE